jgi:hypothetical protein
VTKRNPILSGDFSWNTAREFEKDDDRYLKIIKENNSSY